MYSRSQSQLKDHKDRHYYICMPKVHASNQTMLGAQRYNN